MTRLMILHLWVLFIFQIRISSIQANPNKVVNATIKPDRPSVVEVLCSGDVSTMAASEVSQFVATIDGIRTNVINISSSSVDKKAFDLYISRRIYFGEEVQLSYYNDFGPLETFQNQTVSNQDITECPLTKKKDSGKCVDCALGKFRLRKDSTECELVTQNVCPPGFYYDQDSCKSCTKVLGYSDFYLQGDSSCYFHNKTNECSPGMYQAHGGSSIEPRHCVTCSVGRFSSNPSALSCTAHQVCPKGKYINGSGTSTKDQLCIDCPAGKFNDKVNNAICIPHSICEYRTETNPTKKNDRLCIADLTQTVYCYRGTYIKVVDPEGQFECVACPPGRFTSERNAYSCQRWKKCKFNEYRVDKGTPTSDTICARCNNTGMAWKASDGTDVDSRCVILDWPNNYMTVWLSLAGVALLFGAIGLRRFSQRCCCPRQPIDPRDPKGIRKKALAKRPPPPSKAPPMALGIIEDAKQQQRRIRTF